jgi:hypothetical protein
VEVHGFETVVVSELHAFEDVTLEIDRGELIAVYHGEHAEMLDLYRSVLAVPEHLHPADVPEYEVRHVHESVGEPEDTAGVEHAGLYDQFLHPLKRETIQILFLEEGDRLESDE